MSNEKTKETLTNLSTHLNYGIEIENSNNRKDISLLEFKKLFTKDMINKFPGNSYYNLLESAVINNRYDIVEYLLSFNDWNINRQNQNGETILQYISDNHHFNLETAKLLLKYEKIDTSLSDDWGNNPIWTSVFGYFNSKQSPEKKKAYETWLKLLLQAGFKPNQRTKTKIINTSSADIINNIKFLLK